MDKRLILIVSGLPRSGTSMMMKMLEAGGLEIFSDNIRVADKDNPNGYFEHEMVKRLAKEKSKEWLKDAEGKVVKVISQLLKELPQQHFYKVIFMRRNMNEILDSQRQMLIRRGESVGNGNDGILGGLFRKHLGQVKSWLTEQTNFDVLYIPYNDVLTNPQELVHEVNLFLGGGLDVNRMENVVDKSLYRQRIVATQANSL